ncbi:TetR/AcrR family transcriptional regulator [Streptomyces cyaneus]|uniref:TetR/AcrR family transcriptional regulator n=1 Tax=Streptomyces cyaneus TaxID=1904 RepID=UPI000FF89B66|nr:TetR/AcrR family transcriptional regulator [Streptomyces cyaneus]
MSSYGSRPLGRGPARPQQRRSQETHAALLRAADAGFSTDGWRGTSVERVAAAAGTSVGSVYTRFGSKRDLLLAVVGERLEEITGLVETTEFTELLHDPVGGLRATVALVVTRRRGAAGLLTAWADACIDHPEMRELETGIRDSIVKQLRDRLELLSAHPGMRPEIDLDQLAIAVCGLIEGLHLPPWTSLSDEEATDICSRLILHTCLRDDALPTS